MHFACVGGQGAWPHLQCASPQTGIPNSTLTYRATQQQNLSTQGVHGRLMLIASVASDMATNATRDAQHIQMIFLTCIPH
eukprot:75475-Chlamydomonas_euryale.AAC.2